MRHNQNTGKRESSCHGVTHPNSKRKLSVSIWTKDAPTKALLRNTAYPKPVFLHGAVNSAKNLLLEGRPDIQLETIYHILMAIMPYLPLDEEERWLYIHAYRCLRLLRRRIIAEDLRTFNNSFHYPWYLTSRNIRHWIDWSIKKPFPAYCNGIYNRSSTVYSGCFQGPGRSVFTKTCEIA